MKQVLQDLSNGNTLLVDAPSPNVSTGNVLINTTISLISVGTERMLVDFGKASLIDKARQQPDKVKKVLNKVRTDGLVTTVEAVRSKLAQPLPLGYCNVGIVADVGNNVDGFKPGDRVASNGAHADIVKVPKKLCAKIPDNVDDESAAFTVIASIGLQGLRLAKPTLGESFVVTGVGLIGLLTVQLLRAYGCRVLAIDYDVKKLALAKEFGADICNPGIGEDPVSTGLAFSRGRGVDGVIITASTKSNDPVSQAAKMSRKRGRIILVGVTGLELSRADFYEKELTFQVSCSYGPGRYDPDYEDRGNDYPLAYVRWTEQRNFEAVLDMMGNGQLNIQPLITHRFAFESAQEAYQLLTEDTFLLGVLLNYSSDIKSRTIRNIKLKSGLTFDARKPVVGFIGAGNYASRILIPAFKKLNAQLHTIVTASGINSVIHGGKAGFAEGSSDVDSVFSSKEINTIAIVTQHNTHSLFINRSLQSGKNVFVEKPLALTYEELSKIENSYKEAHLSADKPHLMVGFNRRFSPQIQKMKKLLETINEPKSFIMTMNAGAIPAEHWVQNVDVGGGRIIGEACHFIDLMRFFVGHKITSVYARRMGNSPGVLVTEDKATITLGFADGSFGTINYFSNGAASFPKERIEIFSSGRVLQLDNFRKLRGFDWPGFKKMNLWKQNKGQLECVNRFLNAIETGSETPIPVNEIMEVAKVSIDAAIQLRQQND